MPWFICQYPALPNWKHGTDATIGHYSSFIWAKKHSHAVAIARVRNIGEKVMGTWGTSKSRPYPLTSEMLAMRKRTRAHALDIVHTATFLCYLLMQCRSAPPCDIVGDEGLLHQIVHCLSFGSPRRADVIATVRFYEKRIPGYLPR